MYELFPFNKYSTKKKKKNVRCGEQATINFFFRIEKQDWNSLIHSNIQMS